MTSPSRSGSGIGDLPLLGATHRALREQVADVLRERITRGDLPPGTHLVERVLADSLGVSRVPVRDALNLLKGEGFLTQEPRRGVVVTRLSRKDIEELYDVRSALEVLAVRLATERASDEEIEELRGLVLTSEGNLAEQDPDAVLTTNTAFHDALTAMAHNDLLASLIHPLEGRLHWLLNQNEDPTPFHVEHEALYDAIAARDADAAAVVALRHVLTSRSVCLRLLHPDGPR